MKTIFLIFLLLTAFLYPQWNNVITTTINEPYLCALENFANKDGIHIVIQRMTSSNSIMYYKLNSSGTVLTTTIIESQGYAEFPSIAGANNALYISYRRGNNIITKRYNYLNGNWDQLQTISIGSQDYFRGIDNVYDERGLHLVFASGPYLHQDMKTRYYRYPPGSNNYTDFKDVSEQTYEAAYPTVTLSANKVHVGFNDYGLPKTRDKNFITNTWENIQQVYDDGFHNVHSGCDKLFSFSWLYQGLPLSLFVKERNVGSTNWSNAFMLNYSVGYSDEGHVISGANTFDTKIHILYPTYNLIHRYYDCYSGWSNEESIFNNDILYYDIASTSNDLYTVFQHNYYIKYRQYDVAPLAPQNLTITRSPNNHPLLSWLPNTEPDKNYYKLYRWDSYGGGWQPLAQTSNTSYEDGTLTYCTAIPPQQCPDLRSFQFKVTAVDLGSHESEPSNIVESRLVGGPPSKAGADDLDNKTVFKYTLGQNYPNPFNPATTINYSIKSAGEVTLKVYDMLGKEVASLVNERQEAGNYSVIFNAANLPSGIYFYTLTSGNFMDTKKLILLK